jgi:hypothetical protein
MLNTMIYELTTTKYNRMKDRLELSDLVERYGDDAPSVIAARANDKKLQARDRRHWQRLTKAARYFGPDGLKLNMVEHS